VTRRSVLAVFVDRPWPGATGDMQRVRAMVDAIRPVTDLQVFLAPRGAEAGSPPTGLRVVEAVRPRDMTGAAARAVLGLARSRPLMMAFYRQPAVRDALAAELRRTRPDFVVTHHLGGAGLLDGLVDPSRVILDLPNDEVQRFDRMTEVTSGAQRVRYAVERGLTRRWVGRQLAAFRAVTVVSAEDEAAYRANAPAARLVIVPNGTTPPREPRPDPGGADVMFLGDLKYAPNRDGVGWFVREVLPGCDAVATLRVVGRGSPPVADRVVAVGFAEDLAAELAQVVAMVVPIRAGGGTRLKVLDAFGHGVPVVSTALGVEGIGAEPGVHYLRAETPSEWHGALAAIVADAGLRARLAGAARRLVCERYTWDRAAAPFVDLVVA
jgi:glycosyltransferase involved in cell wall biosynthesis